MNDLGWDVYSFDHEDGVGQFEIDWAFTEVSGFLLKMMNGFVENDGFCWKWWIVLFKIMGFGRRWRQRTVWCSFAGCHMRYSTDNAFYSYRTSVGSVVNSVIWGGSYRTSVDSFVNSVVNSVIWGGSQARWLRIMDAKTSGWHGAIFYRFRPFCGRFFWLILACCDAQAGSGWQVPRQSVEKDFSIVFKKQSEFSYTWRTSRRKQSRFKEPFPTNLCKMFLSLRGHVSGTPIHSRLFGQNMHIIDPLLWNKRSIGHRQSPSFRRVTERLWYFRSILGLF